jgi:hypothetical protein
MGNVNQAVIGQENDFGDFSRYRDAAKGHLSVLLDHNAFFIATQMVQLMCALRAYSWRVLRFRSYYY